MNKKAIRRMADAYFPPQFKTIFIDTDLKVATDLGLMKYLELPFDKKYDTNLTKDRLEVIHYLIDSSIWPDLCRQACTESYRIISENSDLLRLSDTCADEAKKGFEKRITQLQLRLRDEQTKTAEKQKTSVSQRDIEFEELMRDTLIHGIKKPKITLDSVGFICISKNQFGFDVTR